MVYLLTMNTYLLDGQPFIGPSSLCITIQMEYVISYNWGFNYVHDSQPLIGPLSLIISIYVEYVFILWV